MVKLDQVFKLMDTLKIRIELQGNRIFVLDLEKKYPETDLVEADDGSSCFEFPPTLEHKLTYEKE
jgi:hypothetical protein